MCKDVGKFTHMLNFNMYSVISVKAKSHFSFTVVHICIRAKDTFAEMRLCLFVLKHNLTYIAAGSGWVSTWAHASAVLVYKPFSWTVGIFQLTIS